MLEELHSALDSDSSGEESAGEGEQKEVDEDDQAERAKLPQYVSRFKVSVTRPIVYDISVVDLSD